MNIFFRHLRYVANKEHLLSVGKNWLTLLGIGVTAKLLLQGAHAFYNSSVRRPLSLKERYGAGSYVLITGGAQGIGFEFAQRFASQGFNVILMDRDANLLQNAKLTLEHFGITVITEQIDFGPATTYDKYREVFEKFAKLDIAVLINNVGVGAGSFGEFHEIPLSMIHSSFFVNLYPAVFFTKLLMEKNKDRQQKSLVINMSSMSGMSPLPYFFLYGASKNFYLAFSQSLRMEAELEKINMDIVDFSPAYISTALIGFRKGLFVIKTNQFVDSALRSVGRDDRSMGHWIHKLERSIFHLFGSRTYQHIMKEQSRPVVTSITNQIKAAILNAGNQQK